MSANSIAIRIGKNDEKLASSPSNIFLLGLDISNHSPTFQLVSLSTVVFALFLVYGYLLEWIFQQDGMKSHGW